MDSIPMDFHDTLRSIGLPPSKVESLSRNKDALARALEMVEIDRLAETKLAPHQANLLVGLALNGASLGTANRSSVLRFVLEDEITTQIQLTEAINFFKQGGDSGSEAAFRAACGAGVHLSRDDIRSSVEKNLDGQTSSGWDDLRTTMAALKLTPELRWADPAILKEETESLIAKKHGPRPTQIKPKSKAAPKPDMISSSEPPPANIFEEGFFASLHKPGENPQVDDKLRLEHLKATGGKVITRFPPEPNGFLHIGHAKAIAVNFGYAKFHGGVCYLRYDDTNPSKEEQIYFDSILTAVRWLGVNPEKVTYTSDYFDTLFEKAVELIKMDKAYVCQCTFEEREESRGAKGKADSREECVHRRRPIDESLTMFEQMKNGQPSLATATLRMKQDLTDPNPQMWDLLAYRSHAHPHPRTGTRWNIYPTYDFSHCLVDSFENISHSLCTSEFVASRQSYEWLCHTLGVYTPRQYEYGRLNLTNTVMSKRRLHPLVHSGKVSGWDDIRLPTLIAMRRRGVPPEAIMNFVRGLGVTTTMAVTEVSKLDEAIRQFLEPSAPRLFLVLRPVKVIIENLPDDFILMVEKPYHPKNPSMGAGTVPFTRLVYIDADDFRVSGSKDYLRLVPGGSVGLLHVPHPIICTSFQTDGEGNTHTILARYDDTKSGPKPKAFIHWVAECPTQQSPVRIKQVRLAGPLYSSSVPSKDEDINADGLHTLDGSLIEVGFEEIAKAALLAAREAARSRISAAGTLPGVPPLTEAQSIGPECVRFQANRVGYFALDADSTAPYLGNGKGDEMTIVLNRIVSLKEGDSRLAK
ncbi:glutamine-tRNA ligase [Mycena vitilis]|nr:glutamine-tRNA ligase [Mycena vitilis]